MSKELFYVNSFIPTTADVETIYQLEDWLRGGAAWPEIALQDAVPVPDNPSSEEEEPQESEGQGQGEDVAGKQKKSKKGAK